MNIMYKINSNFIATRLPGGDCAMRGNGGLSTGKKARKRTGKEGRGRDEKCGTEYVFLFLARTAFSYYNERNLQCSTAFSKQS